MSSRENLRHRSYFDKLCVEVGKPEREPWGCNLRATEDHVLSLRLESAQEYEHATDTLVQLRSESVNEIKRLPQGHGDEMLLEAIRATGDYLRDNITRRGVAERLDILVKRCTAPWCMIKGRDFICY
jgi:hypothetical protein